MERQRTEEMLARLLRRIDGRGYPAYRELKGSWRLKDCILEVRHVQGDPFASPSRLAVVLPPAQTCFAADLLASASRRTGLSCYLARHFARAARHPRGGRGGRGRTGTGHGHSGRIAMTDPGQAVCANTAVLVGADGGVEARFTAGLPAAGRRIRGRDAERMLLHEVPSLASLLCAEAHDPNELARHAEANEDADALRDQLPERNLVAFVADGALLPRRSGTDDRPLPAEKAVLFESPSAFRVTLDRPNSGPVSGMGIPPGVTLLVGGGFHGKSTVLDAVARGVYNHRPGDGRECVVTDPSAMKVQAEDGRPVTGVDISPFLGALPDGQDTTRFSTRNASGSTSQASAVIEALEAGSRLLLVDEDTAATNFMIRDRRMQALIEGDDEPITPFIDRVRSLYADAGASTLLVAGGSGDYLDVADCVIGMIRYRPTDLTARAGEVAVAHPTGRQSHKSAVRWPARHRSPDPASIRPERGRRARSIKVRDRHTVDFGTERIDLSGVSQIVSEAQTRAVALALAASRRFMRPGATVEDSLQALERALARDGLDALEPRRTGDLVAPRMQEVAAALNRLRSLSVRPAAPSVL